VHLALEGLESRELLSAVITRHAEIAAFQAVPSNRASTISQLPTAPSRTASTIPPNGDLNPYGVAFVPQGFARGGLLNPGDVLVSNFNNSNNLQGTGTTIVRVTPDNQTSVFFQGSPGLGLTTALGVLKRGYVIVGNLPSTDGTSNTAMQGSLLVLDKNGQQVGQFADANLLNGPWDMTIHDAGHRAQIFVSNVLSGSISRFNVNLPPNGGFHVVSAVQIASGYTHMGDPAAFEIGPTGLAFDSHRNTLYVASTGDNAIYVIHNAASLRSDHGTGAVLYQDNAHLHGPLGLAFASDGNLITSNGDAINPDPNNPSTLVEFTRKGQFVGQFSLDPNPGAAFGIASSLNKRQFAAVEDVTNSVTIWNVRR
jgi:hypothetical protein